jgi:hypothetical protein
MADNMKEMLDPEMSYRRGFQQGASELFDAIKPALQPAQAALINEWINNDLLKWRLAAISGESKRHGERITDDCTPPTQRLAAITGK